MNMSAISDTEPLAFNTVLMPTGNQIPTSDPVIEWDPDTGLCEYSCAIRDWAESILQDTQGDYGWWDKIHCPITNCTVQDYEKDIIKRIIAIQNYYENDGTLRASYSITVLTELCLSNALTVTEDCDETDLADLAGQVETYADIAQVLQTWLWSRGGIRPNLPSNVEAARLRLTDLADLACTATPWLAGDTASTYGTKVHQKFNELVEQLHTQDPAYHGETWYQNQGWTDSQPPGGGSAAPDAVYGNRANPSAIFDLKTQNARIKSSWVTKLRNHLPVGNNAPVIMIKGWC